MQFRKKKKKKVCELERFFIIQEGPIHEPDVFFQEFIELLGKTLGLSLLETVERGLISNEFNFDRERDTSVDICFMYSPSVLPVTALSKYISPK